MVSVFHGFVLEIVFSPFILVVITEHFITRNLDVRQVTRSVYFVENIKHLNGRSVNRIRVYKSDIYFLKA